MKKPLLSILIPTVPQRFNQLKKLVESLQSQDGADAVEILYCGDNRKRTIGEKRNNLLQMANGKYVAFCDDDDRVCGEYIPCLAQVADEQNVDVISFRQSAVWDGQHSEVFFSVENKDEQFNPGGITKRFPWHVCAWRRELAQRGVFAHSQWGEDAAWVAQMKPLARKEAHIPLVLHYYEHGAGSLAH
jgi:hypothetical protein